MAGFLATLAEPRRKRHMTRAPDFAARRAELSPDAPAFTDHFTGRPWTFAEVDAEAARLARFLRAEGFAEGARIAILCLNRVEFFVALFAARKAGLILCPLNWRQPVAELRPVVESVGCAAIIHDTDHAETAASLGLPRIPMAPGGRFRPGRSRIPPARAGRGRAVVPALHLGHHRAAQGGDPDAADGAGERGQHRAVPRPVRRRPLGLLPAALPHRRASTSTRCPSSSGAG
jgi:non-ribosomal peptide synthetase component F